MTKTNILRRKGLHLLYHFSQNGFLQRVLSWNSFLTHHHSCFPTFHKMGLLYQVFKCSCSFLWLVGPEARRTLWTPPRSWGRYVWVPNRWSRRGGSMWETDGLFYGWEVNEETWIFWKHVDIGDDIFWGDILEIIYIYIYVLGVIFFEITVYFLGDLFLGSFFSPITWIYPAPQPSWVLSVWLFDAFFCLRSFKRLRIVSQESRIVFFLLNQKSIYLPGN